MGIPHEIFFNVYVYFSDTFHKNIDLLIEQFQDRDWIEIPHETFVIVWFYILVIHLTRTLSFLLSNFKIETR